MLSAYSNLFSNIYFSFIYYEQTALNGDTVLGVLYAAKKYMLPALENVCKEFLEKELDPNNVMPVFEQVSLKITTQYASPMAHVEYAYQLGDVYCNFADLSSLTHLA